MNTTLSPESLLALCAFTLCLLLGAITNHVLTQWPTGRKTSPSQDEEIVKATSAHTILLAQPGSIMGILGFLGGLLVLFAPSGKPASMDITTDANTIAMMLFAAAGGTVSAIGLLIVTRVMKLSGQTKEAMPTEVICMAFQGTMALYAVFLSLFVFLNIHGNVLPQGGQVVGSVMVALAAGITLVATTVLHKTYVHHVNAEPINPDNIRKACLKTLLPLAFTGPMAILGLFFMLA